MEDPMPELAPTLVNAAENAEKPFGQYCALRALRKLVERSEDQMHPGLVGQLNRIAITAGRGTDRAREIATILSANSLKQANKT